jgi:4-hydroxy-3-methylbut-2-enyl diphosphate reductase
MAPQCEVVIVVGSPNSSNSNRLREVAQHMGAQAYMVDRASEARREVRRAPHSTGTHSKIS